MTQPSRRSFFRIASSIVILPLVPSALRAAVRAPNGGPHPEPRAGISAAKVASNEQLKAHPKAISTFALAREIPAVLDGIRCQCGCTDGKAYYSMLSCFEMPDIMAADCPICQAQARLAHRLFKAGKSLDEIRKGIDAKFG